MIRQVAHHLELNWKSRQAQATSTIAWSSPSVGGRFFLAQHDPEVLHPPSAAIFPGDLHGSILLTATDPIPKIVIRYPVVAPSPWDVNGGLLLAMSDEPDPATFGYLDRYLIASESSVRHPTSIDIVVAEAPPELVCITNADLEHGDDVWTLGFPPHMNAECPFVHLVDAATIRTLRFRYLGATNVDVILYGDHPGPGRFDILDRVAVEIDRHMQRLERNFGAFPTTRLIVRLTGGRAGMEYAGAIVTSPESLSHELVHCYFGRCVLPRSGRDGWIDEAIATWYAGGRDSRRAPNPAFLDRALMGGRATAPEAYTRGPELLEKLARAIGGRDALLDFLRRLFEWKRWRLLDTAEFCALAEAYAERSLAEVFEGYFEPQS